MAGSPGASLRRPEFRYVWALFAGTYMINNVVCSMEWIPDLSLVKELEAAFEDYGGVEAGKAMSDLGSTVELLTGHQGPMGPALLRDFITIAMGTPEWGPGDDGRLTDVQKAETIQRLLAGNVLRREESNRYTVALALCEAETLRRVIHQRVLAKETFIPDSNVQIALTMVPSKPMTASVHMNCHTLISHSHILHALKPHWLTLLHTTLHHTYGY